MKKQTAGKTKTSVKAKPAKQAQHAKAAPSNAQLQKEIVKLQTEVAASKKHAPAKKTKTKHAATTTASSKHAAKPALALGEGFACCSAEALAASLRRTGRLVTDLDVLQLYMRTAGDPDEGATILDTLEAAARSGLAGVRPVSFRPVYASEIASAAADRRDHQAVTDAGGDMLEEMRPALLDGDELAAVGTGHAGELSADDALAWYQIMPGGGHPDPASLLLGLVLPGGRHSVTAHRGGLVWSWGDLYEPGPARLEEAWVVTWQ